MINELKELYDYREMIFSLVHKELRGKYKGSFLGFFWSLLTPLFQLLVYTIVFSVFMGSTIEKFYLFLFVALIPWLFFSNCVMGGATSILQQKNLVEKVYFPRKVLPLSYALSCFINMLLSFIVVFAALFLSRVGVNIRVLCFLPLIMLIELFMGMGVSLLFSAITVYFRDLEFVLNIVTMAWMYMTPILYPMEQIPENIRPLLYLNPMTAVVISYRDILYYKTFPDLRILGYAVLWGGLVFVTGWFLFGRLQKNFVEEF